MAFAVERDEPLAVRRRRLCHTRGSVEGGCSFQPSSLARQDEHRTVLVRASTRDDLEATAFINGDGTVAVVAMNRTDKELPLALKFAGRAADTLLPPHAIATYTFAGGA